MRLSYADSNVWNRRFESEGDLDWGGLWTDPFIDLLRRAGCEDILDLGCGTGNDVARLVEAGFTVIGSDFSNHALQIAKSKNIPNATFVEGDMTKRIPFPDAHFDAVFSNVALHMFSNSVAASIIQEIHRILRSKGIFIFHVNSTEDRELRAKRKKVWEQLEENRIREEDGQTVHFFSNEELKSYFSDWSKLELEHVIIEDKHTGKPFKGVWRGCANR